MDIDPREKQEHQKNKVQKERRDFLKKAAYAAPTLVIMGQLVNPTGAKAWDTGDEPVVASKPA
jgi:hypothetical protein